MLLEQPEIRAFGMTLRKSTEVVEHRLRYKHLDFLTTPFDRNEQGLKPTKLDRPSEDVGNPSFQAHPWSKIVFASKKDDAFVFQGSADGPKSTYDFDFASALLFVISHGAQANACRFGKILLRPIQ